MREQKVMLDKDLAEFYGVETFNLNKAVKRNCDRFPEDFMFQLTKEEYNSLRFQFGILSQGEHSKYLPYVFTEQGVAMLSAILKSERAIQVSVAIMRAFIKMRQLLASQSGLAKKVLEVEEKCGKRFLALFKEIHKLKPPPPKPGTKRSPYF
ncbi:MAG: ORF6N domain-containing protein [Patescibacteria group bacterium]